MALYLDIHGNITETGGSNFVIYRDRQVISPRRNNILWGISLNVLQEILADMNIPFIERDIQTADAINAEEAWLLHALVSGTSHPNQWPTDWRRQTGSSLAPDS